MVEKPSTLEWVQSTLKVRVVDSRIVVCACVLVN